MRIDFHVHTAVSKQLGFDLQRLKQTMTQAKQIGVDAFVMTNHYDTEGFADVFPVLDGEFKYKKPFYKANGISIIPGIELSTKEGPHILVAGSRGHIRKLHEWIHADLAPNTKPDAATCFKHIAKLKVLTICAHPFNNGRTIARLDKSLRTQFDAIELNGNQLAQQGKKLRDRVNRLGRTLKLPVVAGSDTHVYPQMGCIVTRLPGKFDSISELRDLLRQKKHRQHQHRDLVDMVETAHKLKSKLT